VKTAESRNLIDFITTHTTLSQADLARKLKVSPAQISKWKAGDSLSTERTSQLLRLAGLFDTVNVEWAIFARSKQNAEAWYSYVFRILEDVEWGDSLEDFFHDMPDVYVSHLITDLRKLGANINSQAPEFDEEGESTDLDVALFSILENWGQLSDWLHSTLEFDDLTNDAEYELFDITSDLEWLLFDLALDHVDFNELDAIGVNASKLTATVKDARFKIKSHLHDICQIRTKHSLPITGNYFQVLYLSPVELAEQEWFRPGGSIADHVNEDSIKPYLPYGQQLILLHLEYSALALRQLDEKLDRITERLNSP
jgi:transcriptional regulator with XRE-family HTH domain